MTRIEELTTNDVVIVCYGDDDGGDGADGDDDRFCFRHRRRRARLRLRRLDHRIDSDEEQVVEALFHCLNEIFQEKKTREI